jgi:hypothetical protein
LVLKERENMWVILRDITVNKDVVKELPVANLQLEEGREYIIADYESILDPSEFDSIPALNDFLKYCEENDISEDTLSILSKVYFYKEVVEAVMNDNYTIINFTDETADWNYGSGGNHTEEDMGRCLFETGCYLLPFEVTEEMVDWIDWSHAWTDACCQGWVEVNYKDNLYLVKRWMV